MKMLTATYFGSVDAADPNDINCTIIYAHAVFQFGIWSRAPAIH